MTSRSCPARRSSTCARCRSTTSRSCPRPAPPTSSAFRPAAFIETIGRVARSASRDETRPHLTGVLVSASERELRMVATDSYRLSVKETTLEEPIEGQVEANVPARTLQELSADRERRGRRRDRDRRARAPGDLHASATSCCRRGSSRAASRTTSSCCPRRSSTSCGSPAARCSRSCGGSSLLAQKNAPLRLKFSEGAARDLRADARRRRGQRGAARSRSTARRSRSASTRTSSATASRARSRRSSSSS